jgi:diguanylate cyclase (GGDEF)-like protein
MYGNRGAGDRQQAADQTRCARRGALFREYNYILKLSAAEQSLLDAHREILVCCAAGFAEVFYNYLFDHPDIAEVLYAFEREGGDVGMLARASLQSLLASVHGGDSREQEAALVAAGASYQEHGFKPLWIIGAYNLLEEHLRDMLPEQGIPPDERTCLEVILSRVHLRDMGVTLEAYWGSADRSAQLEFAHLVARLGEAEDILSGIPHYLWSVDVQDNSVCYANYPFRTLYEGRLAAPLPVLDSAHPDDRQQLLTVWQDAISGRSRHAEVRLVLAGGEMHWYRLSVFPCMNRQGCVTTVHCVLEDINHQINERIQLQQFATTDRLTGLPNRAMWTDHLNMALAASRRVPGSRVVVMSLDINQFKMYNDTLGIDVGDILLHDIAERLKSIVRESDSLARLGGDQFGILLHPVIHVRDAAERVITKVIDCFDIPFTCRGRQLCVSLTLGIACFPEDGTSEEALLTNAESAMQRAKRNGLPYQYFDPVNDVSSIQQLRYSGQLRTALENDEFELHYQPQINLQSSRITGAEALLRWDHPGEGVIMPCRIIPIAEQLGMMMPITDWVLVSALSQCREWQRNGLQIRVSVNVSARSFQNPRLLEKIKSALNAVNVSGGLLEIEITEATLMQDTERAAGILASLCDLGVTIAIDDFGTGYSSLSYLKKLPIHTLKIDQSFITHVVFDHQDIAIVRSIIELGHNLGYKVVAEGVESRSAWELLASLGCDTAQGFHISEPLTDNGFSRLLAERRFVPG